jgi:light-regulated signal transduction histidine kinase (bacteriophytochrome)
MDVININDVISSIACLIQDNASGHSGSKQAPVCLNTQFGEVPHVFAQATDLKQALTAIVNAMLPAARTAPITVRTLTDKQSALVEISGIGVDNEAINKSFGLPFSMKDLSNADLDLVMARLVISRHGGSIEIQNQAQSTTLLIRLPGIGKVSNA